MIDILLFLMITGYIGYGVYTDTNDDIDNNIDKGAL